MQSIRVSPNEENPNYHISLKDRNGTVVGLTICNSNGKPESFYYDGYVKSPVNTTAFKQTSGNGGYDIFEYPYTPIVQDDWSGGRGNLDFERDSTKYFDSNRAATGRANKAFAGPLEQYTEGAHRSALQEMPGNVDWIVMTGANRYIYKRILATTMTVSKVWLDLRRLSTPGDLTVELWSDSGGDLSSKLTSLTIPYTWTNDTLSEWINDTLAQTLSSGTYYWLVVYADSGDNDRKHWKIAVKEEAGTTYAGDSFSSSPSAATFDLYYRLTDADSAKTCIPFEYKEQQYFVISGASGAPKLYMAGDRGAADSNSGQLDKLIDASKSWTTDEHAGYIVMITDGPGKLEQQPWRTITTNASGSLTVDEAWSITHTTTTEYVILSPVLKEITGHGLTAPVTDVLVSTTGVAYFCMGDDVVVRRLRAYNDSGTWRDFDDATNCQADEGTAKAVFMVYKSQAKRIVIGNNSDANGNVSVTTNTDTSIPAWGTALTWATAVTADSKYRKINGMIVHPDASGYEAVWVFKTDMPYIAGGTTTIDSFYPAGSDEMTNVRSISNGVEPIRHDVYLYFPLLQGLERYYGGTYTDMGPNLGEGLPENRRGPIVAMLGYPGKFFVAIDAGDGYSSIMASGGWHESYRGPKGQRIKSMAFQVIPGTDLDRLWFYQGNDLIWLPFPSDSTNELEDTSYEYAPEFALDLSRMHAGMYDVQKMIKFLKLQTDKLEKDSSGREVCWFEIDYKLNDNDEWTHLEDTIDTSPTQGIDFSSSYGLAGRRLRFRIRGYTRDRHKTPVLLAIVIFAVMRVDIKNFYGPLSVLCEDNEPIGLREEDKIGSALDKLKIIEDWGDASNDSMLLMNSVASMFDNKMVFINVGTRRQVRFKGSGGSDAFVVDITLQDA